MWGARANRAPSLDPPLILSLTQIEEEQGRWYRFLLVKFILGTLQHILFNCTPGGLSLKDSKTNLFTNMTGKLLVTMCWMFSYRKHFITENRSFRNLHIKIWHLLSHEIKKVAISESILFYYPKLFSCTSSVFFRTMILLDTCLKRKTRLAMYDPWNRHKKKNRK